jgi:hypothetical protein
MADLADEDYTYDFTFNRIHKRFMVLYDSTDMRYVWKKVRSDFKKEFKVKLPKRFRKYPELWNELNNWIEKRILDQVEAGGDDTEYLNKADLIERGWDNKLLELIYPEPDKRVYLGRGRYAYYYDGKRVGELEDTEEFIEYIAAKLERKRKREAAKRAREARNQGFGTEFIG